MKNSKELVKITLHPIGGVDSETVHSSELHAFLGIGKDHSNWVKDRIKQYGFEEGKDYEIIVAKFGDNSKKRGNHAFQRIDYKFSVDMAKELAMVENNEKGRQIRRWFIEAEKERRMMVVALPDPEDALRHSVLALMRQCGSKDRIYKSIATAGGLSNPYVKYWLDGKKPLPAHKLHAIASRVEYLRRLYAIGLPLDTHFVESFELRRPDEVREGIRPLLDREPVNSEASRALRQLYNICLDVERLMYYDFSTLKPVQP